MHEFFLFSLLHNMLKDNGNAQHYTQNVCLDVVGSKFTTVGNKTVTETSVYFDKTFIITNVF